MGLDPITGISYWNVSFDEWIRIRFLYIGGLSLRKRIAAVLRLLLSADRLRFS